MTVWHLRVHGENEKMGGKLGTAQKAHIIFWTPAFQQFELIKHMHTLCCSAVTLSPSGYASHWNDKETQINSLAVNRQVRILKCYLLVWGASSPFTTDTRPWPLLPHTLATWLRPGSHLAYSCPRVREAIHHHHLHLSHLSPFWPWLFLKRYLFLCCSFECPVSFNITYP